MVGYYDKMSRQPARAWFSKRERKVDTTPAVLNRRGGSSFVGCEGCFCLIIQGKCGKVVAYGRITKLYYVDRHYEKHRGRRNCR